MRIWNRRILRFIIPGMAVLIGALAADIQWNHPRRFDAPLIDIRASSDPQTIARGDYLVHGPARCADCHGDARQRDAIARGEKVPLSGGIHEDTLLGRIVFPNITPDPETGIGRLSDGQIARFLRTGINHRGEYGLPFMDYRTISPADLLAIVSFLRAQPPVRHEVPASRYNFLGKLTLRWFLAPGNPGPVYADAIRQQQGIPRGRYLAEALASCRDCHTRRSMITGAYVGEFYEGGLAFEAPEDEREGVTSPSLRPDAKGRIAGFDREQFVARMRAGSTRSWSPMPWGPYSGMTEADLDAIYLYLASLHPEPLPQPADGQEPASTHGAAHRQAPPGHWIFLQG